MNFKYVTYMFCSSYETVCICKTASFWSWYSNIQMFCFAGVIILYFNIQMVCFSGVRDWVHRTERGEAHQGWERYIKSHSESSSSYLLRNYYLLLKCWESIHIYKLKIKSERTKPLKKLYFLISYEQKWLWVMLIFFKSLKLLYEN